MTFEEYVQVYYGVNDWENYWSDYDESQIISHYVEYLCTQELADYDLSLEKIHEMKSLELQEHFYDALYDSYGAGIPMYIVVASYGDDALVEFMHEFYYTYAEKSGYLVYPSEAPAISSAPEVSLNPTATPAPSLDVIKTPQPKASEGVTPEAVTGISADAINRIYAEEHSQTIIMTMILFCIVFFWCEKKIKNAVRGFHEWRQS